MIDLFLKGGPLMWCILVCSVAALAAALYKTVELVRASRQLSGTPEAIVGSRAPVLTPVLDAIDSGRGETEIALAGNRQLRRLQRGLGVLSLVAVVSPLLGLTGTVTGMIQAFQTIAAQPGRVEASLLAGGIWQALLTTAAGLLVAIPAHVAFHFLDARLDDIAAAMKEITVALMEEKRRGV